ncbi:MAG TPA: phosphoribosylaminoimidazolesuccinocarboxamide synthase [Microbacteriaceae bacterium]|nr:phosphoribosylaminoimidazolesuccinocarboxamide synthase [Microbacteriaceae bacterium]
MTGEMFTSGDLEGWTLVYSGKVRDLYVPNSIPSDDDSWTGDALDRTSIMLVVASDRVSAFDHVLRPGIPGKGQLLTELSHWWFDRLDIANHRASGELPTVPEAVAARSMVVKPLDMYPIECVVRGYLTGSGWKEYQSSQTLCGIPLPSGLRDGDRLPEPIYTPAYKAPLGEHDENISFEQSVDIVGVEVASALRDASLRVFREASAVAEERGLILADTKFEFGADRATGELTLADEVLTSDSSRYWDAERYCNGGPDRMDSFDKQVVRNWLAANWDQQGIPPRLPDDIVRDTAQRYRELITRLSR